jgi:hypothetical protein
MTDLHPSVRRALAGAELSARGQPPRAAAARPHPRPHHVRPAERQGTRGFRFWTEPAGKPNRAPCGCGWAAHLAEHYRVELPV